MRVRVRVGACVCACVCMCVCCVVSCVRSWMPAVPWERGRVVGRFLEGRFPAPCSFRFRWLKGGGGVCVGVGVGGGLGASVLCLRVVLFCVCVCACVRACMLHRFSPIRPPPLKTPASQSLLSAMDAAPCDAHCRLDPFYMREFRW